MDLPVTTPMSKLHKQLTWRKQQLSWFAEPVIIKQDQQLIDYMKHNHIRHAMIHGDDFFSQHINKVDHGPVEFIICIKNTPFKFSQLASEINYEIANNLSTGGVLYLAVNKFLCTEPESDVDLLDNYDHAILQYMQKHVNAVIEQHFPDSNSVGSMFNWVHPLTRFYFKNENNRKIL